MISSNVIKKIEEDKHKCKVSDRNLEQLGIILRAVDLMWVAAQDIDMDDDDMSNDVRDMAFHLVEEIGYSLSESGHVSCLQSVSDHIRENVYDLLKKAGYADDDAGCSSCEYDAAKFIVWRHQMMVDEMKGWEKQKEEAA